MEEEQARPRSSSTIQREEREKYCLNLIALSSMYTID
jgi:hypothetical protein